MTDRQENPSTIADEGFFLSASTYTTIVHPPPAPPQSN